MPKVKLKDKKQTRYQRVKADQNATKVFVNDRQTHNGITVYFLFLQNGGIKQFLWENCVLNVLKNNTVASSL